MLISWNCHSVVKNYDDTETTNKAFPFIYIENARHVYLELGSNEVKMPNLYDGNDEQFEMFSEPIQSSVELSGSLKQCKK